MDADIVKSYVENLRDVLSHSPLMEQKAFIRSFVKEVKVTGGEVLLTYTIPLPPDGVTEDLTEVLDTVQNGGRCRTRTYDPLCVKQMLSPLS